MRTNYYFLTAAAASMLMLTACTHDDSSSSASAPVSNELIISTRHSEMGITRAESNIQGTMFDLNEQIDVFLRDASNAADTTRYAHNPKIYKVTDTTTGAIKTYIGDNENRLFWPKLMHDLYIFGVYPVGSVSWNNVVDNTNPTHANYNPFSDTQYYYFTVQENQTSQANYKASDLMTGLPSGYTYTGKTPYTAPFKLTQYENPGIVPLTFTHRLTNIIVNVTRTTGTQDTDIPLDDIKYIGTNDKKYARVTLLNTKRKTTFQVPSTDVLDNGDASHATSPSTDIVVVGRGSTTITTGGYTAVTLSAIVPPQDIVATTPFIKVDLIDEDRTDIDPSVPGNRVTDTFYYKIPGGGLTLEASKVHTYNIRINKPHIDVTTSITDWVAVDAVNSIGTLQ